MDLQAAVARYREEGEVASEPRVARRHHADGSLRLRYGALLDIRIPAQDIAAARVERRSDRGKLAAGGAGGSLSPNAIIA